MWQKQVRIQICCISGSLDAFTI